VRQKSKCRFFIEKNNVRSYDKARGKTSKGYRKKEICMTLLWHRQIN